MRFRNIFLSVFIVFAFALTLVHAEDKAPRGPKITNKVCMTGRGLYMSPGVCPVWHCFDANDDGNDRSTLISSMVISQWAEWCLDCTERRFPRWVEQHRQLFFYYLRS